METMIRKEWNSPKGNVQEFPPQEFVATCEVPIGTLPAGYGKTFCLDGWDNDASTCGHTADR